MALKIIWSRRAEQGFDRIVTYLLANWSEKEVKLFIQETSNFLELLSENPEMLQKFRRHPKTIPLITEKRYQ